MVNEKTLTFINARNCTVSFKVGEVIVLETIAGLWGGKKDG